MGPPIAFLLNPRPKWRIPAIRIGSIVCVLGLLSSSFAKTVRPFYAIYTYLHICRHFPSSRGSYFSHRGSYTVRPCPFGSLNSALILSFPKVSVVHLSVSQYFASLVRTRSLTCLIFNNYRLPNMFVIRSG